MFCRACGNEIPDGAGFCSSCGTPVSVLTDAPVDPPVDKPVDQPTDDAAVVATATPPTVPTEAPELAQDAAAQNAAAQDAVAAVTAAPEETPPPVLSLPTVLPSPPVSHPPVFTPPGPPEAPPSYGGHTAVRPAGYAPSGSTPSGSTPGGPGGYPVGGPAGYPTGGPSSYGGYGPYGAGVPGPYGIPGAPPRKSRPGLWLGIAAATVILIGAGLAVWLVVRDKDDGTTTTTKVVQTTSTTARVSTSTSVASSSTSTSTSTTLPVSSGAPGDSAGEWVELDISGLPAGAFAVAVSDDALLIDMEEGDGYALHAYLLDSETLVELPIEASNFYDEDIDGLVAVWWEYSFDENTGEASDEHIYAYLLPDGPKVEIADGEQPVYYPQIAGPWVTWVEDEPWKENPEEYRLRRIYGVKIDSTGAPVGEPIELVPSATAYALGDAGWSYSLSGTHLAWENAAAVGSFDPGIYTMNLDAPQPLIVGNEAWRPSIGGDTIVYTQSGLLAADLNGGKARALDPLGDFATAASTFAAYFRTVESTEGTSYEIVARGFTGSYEQVLGRQTDAPWLSAAIAASDRHVAFIVDGVAHLYEWQGVPTY